MASLDVRNMTRRPAPRFAYDKAREAVLPTWDISLVFVGSARAKSLNQTLRNKTYVPNVLSYTTGKKSGEIIICPDEVKKQAKKFALSERDFSGLLFIHGLMHLKGYQHGPTMEKMERAVLARFSPRSLLNEKTTHSSRHRYRNAPDARRGGGRSTHR